jgi:hypothetical protein
VAVIFAFDLRRGRNRLCARARALAPAALVLALAPSAVGGVNSARWGNPLIFAPLDRAELLNQQYPDRLTRVKRYGEFNLEPVPFALEYYLVPAFALGTCDGPPPLATFQSSSSALTMWPKHSAGDLGSKNL